MNSFTFKRGKLRSPETWNITDAQLSCDEGQTVIFENLTGVGFADVPGGKVMVTELVLETDREKVKLQCNDVRRGQDRHQFLMLCRTLAERLATVRSDIRVTPTGGQKFLEWSFALMGLGAMVWGAYFVAISLMDWNTGSGFGLGMGLFAILFGAFIAWCVSPWKKVEPKTPSETVEWIDRIRTMG